MSRGTRRSVAAALFLVLLASMTIVALGCGTARNGADTTAGSVDESIAHPTGATDLVLQVSSAGGLAPVATSLTQIPEFSLYGDGTVIVRGPVIAIYPGPALPNLQTTTVTEDTVQAILSAARDVGLFSSEVDYGRPGITDMYTTTITIYANGTAYQSDIYALGMEEGASGLTLEQQQTRAAITDLVGRLQDVTVFQTDELQWSPYEYISLAVFSTPIDPDQPLDSGGVEPTRLEWPLGDLAILGTDVLPDGYRKIIVSSDILEEVRPLLQKATQATVWVSGGREYLLYLRPLLPDQQD